jgi:hypothetical protein
VKKLTNLVTSLTKSVISLTKSETSLTKSETDLTNLMTDLVNKMVKNRQLEVSTRCRPIEIEPPRRQKRQEWVIAQNSISAAGKKSALASSAPWRFVLCTT